VQQIASYALPTLLRIFINEIHLMQERSEPLITKTEELLRIFQLKKQDLTDANIEISDFERAIDPTFLGKSLHFLVKVSFARSLFLWPFLSTINIKIKSEENNQEFPVKNRKDRSSVGLNSDAWYLSSDTEDEDAQKGSTHLSLARDKNDEEDNDDLLEKQEKQETHSTHVLTSSALLLGSENALKGVSRVSAFLDTSDSLLNGVWNAFLTSLIINGLVNYLLYPEEREPTDLVDAFGITGLRNILCIRSIETIRNSFLCSSNYQKGYDDILSSSLSSYYIWPFIAGTPLIFGVINAIHASWNMKKLEKQDIKVLIQQLREYEPGFWADGLGWLFTAAIPDLLPPVAILFILPQPAIKQALEKIRHSIIWDGRLSAKARKKLFNELREFAEQRSQFTQMKALSMLADIVEGINFKNLALMKEEGVDEETIKTLIIIKAQALKYLVFLANHYNLPEEPYSKFKPLFRYLYANYLMWNLGYPQQAFLQPLFFFSKAVKLYYTLLFLKAILGGTIEIINNYLDKKNCLEAGNEWSYFASIDLWNCTVCEDFNIFYRDIFNVTHCVRGYFNGALRRSFDDIMNNITNRGQKKNLWGINRSFNLGEITELNFTDIDFKPGQLALLLNALKPKMVGLQNFRINGLHFNLTDSDAVGQFIQATPIEKLELWVNLNDEWLISIANVLPKSTIKHLSLKGYFSFNISISAIEALAKGLENSSVKELDIGPEDNVMEIITAILPYLNITRLEVDSDHVGCLALAKLLPLSPIQWLKIKHYPFLENFSLCANALIKAITNITHEFNLDLQHSLDDNSINLLAKALPISTLKTLKFKPKIGVTQPSISALIQAFPKSQLVDCEIDFNFNDRELNCSVIIRQLADALNLSMINRFPFELSTRNSRDIELLTSFLPNKLRKITHLSLSYIGNEIVAEQVKAFLKVLPHTNIEELSLFGINMRNTSAVLAEFLPQTMIKILRIREQLTVEDISFLTKALKQSKIEELNLSNIGIGDEGARVLFEGLQGSPVKILNLFSNGITDIGAKYIAQALATTKHGLWIEKINTANQMSLIRSFAYNPRTRLTSVEYLGHNSLTNEGAKAICNVLPQTEILPSRLLWDGKLRINQSIIDNCGVVSSSNSLRPTGPYVLLYRLFQASRQSLSTFVFNSYEKFTIENIKSEPGFFTVEPTQSPLPNSLKHKPNIIDASDDFNTNKIFASPLLLHSENFQNKVLKNQSETEYFEELDISQSSATNEIQSDLSSYMLSLFEMPIHISRSLFDSLLNAMISGTADTVEQCPCYFAKDNSKFWSNNRGQSLFFNRPTSLHTNANSTLNLPSISSGFIGRG
jgi:hypothetical protein